MAEGEVRWFEYEMNGGLIRMGIAPEKEIQGWITERSAAVAELVKQGEIKCEHLLRSVAEEYIKVCDPMFPDESWADLNEDEQSEILEDLEKMYKTAAWRYGYPVENGRLYDRSGQELHAGDEDFDRVYSLFLDGVIAKYGGKEWYAVLRDGEDNDHGNGTYDYDGAVRMLREMATSGYPDAYIAVIDPKDDFCLGAIYLEDLPEEEEER